MTSTSTLFPFSKVNQHFISKICSYVFYENLGRFLWGYRKLFRLYEALEVSYRTYILYCRKSYCWVTRYSNISETRFHHSVANVIKQHQRLLIQRHFTFMLILLFRLDVRKNPLMTANKVRHSPFSYHIFAWQVKAAIQNALHARMSTFHEKRTKACAAINFFLSVNECCGTNDILYHC